MSLETCTILAFCISLLIQVGYPLSIALYFRRRTAAPWQAFLYGTLIFAVFQLFTWLPLRVYLDTLMTARLRDSSDVFLWMLALALSTALVEEAGRLVGFRFLFSRGGLRLNWRNGVMYGLGHGTLETVLLIAGLTFVHLLAYLTLHRGDWALLVQSLGADGNTALGDALYAILDTTWDQPLIVALERVLALPHQVAWSLMVMSSLIARQKRWFFFAMLYHASIALIVPGLVRLVGFGLAEAANVLFALISLWIIIKLRSLLPQAPPVAQLRGKQIAE
ncbi:MAG: YhfC family intramembrane metalloprotease [Chloroflexi bacterium]|nr:YhfC family intramembrane metalloprotease [Chloroflexota bacterium]